jgi:hypothetical protein
MHAAEPLYQKEFFDRLSKIIRGIDSEKKQVKVTGVGHAHEGHAICREADQMICSSSF